MAARTPMTVPAVAARKVRDGGDPLVMVTAYDAPGARIADEAGVDMILVGDSLAMVVLGSLIQLPAPVLAVAKIIQTAALAMAMAALGLGMQLRGLRNVGWRPLLLGLVATLIVSMVALTGVVLIG